MNNRRKLILIVLGVLTIIFSLTTYCIARSFAIRTTEMRDYGLVNSQVSSSSDDGEEILDSGEINLTKLNLELGVGHSYVRMVGMRFNNITIPNGATILKAKIVFEVGELGTDLSSVTINGEAVDHASVFNNTKKNISSRSRTEAMVIWNDINPWDVQDLKHETPDISAIIQEIINRPSWTSGNSIAIILNGTGHRAAKSYDGDSLAAPKIAITYTTGEFITAIAPADSDGIKFGVIGDYGNTGQDEENVAELVKSWDVDFIITTGDNNYPNGESTTIDLNIGQYFQAYIYPYYGIYGDGSDINRFFPALGNHDLHQKNAKPYLEYFSLPGNERYYDFVWGSVHFFVINTNDNEPDGRSRLSKQAEWLQAQLSASTSYWNVVYMHHSPYSSVGSGSLTILQWPYSEWGADVVLSGHKHVYERIMMDGIPYFVNGLGGSSIHTFESPLMNSEVLYNDEYGAMLVEADDSIIKFKFITVSRKVIDCYVLRKFTEEVPYFTITPLVSSELTPTFTLSSTPIGTEMFSLSSEILGNSCG